MSTEKDLFERRQSLGEQTLSITVEQFLDFVAEHKSNGPCESCGSDDWIYAQENDKPAIMGTANVRSPDTSNWFFFMTCGHCANTRLLGAGLIWNHYFGTKEIKSER